MPLTDIGQPPLASTTELRWQMTDGEKAVVVSAPFDMIYAMTPGSEQPATERFLEQRARFCAVASAKFDKKGTDEGALVRLHQLDLFS